MLSPIQKEIVELQGNLIVRASAGTGKTHTMGSGMDKTNEKLMPSCPGAKLLDGKVFASNINIAELNAWVESLKLYSE